jgi:hypothetical protein
MENVKFSSPTLTFLFARNIKHNCSDSSEFEHHAIYQLIHSLSKYLLTKQGRFNIIITIIIFNMFLKKMLPSVKFKIQDGGEDGYFPKIHLVCL